MGNCWKILVQVLVLRRKNNADSFIVSDENINIIEITPPQESDENIYLYLRHHILHTQDVFEKTYFEQPVFVKFKYLNETYRICLSKLESSSDDHLEITKSPRLLWAAVDQKDVTDKLREFHGPSRNFFNHIPDAITDISHILAPNKGKLHTYDIMGKNKVIDIV